MAERTGADSWRARYELDRIFSQNDMKRVKVETVINAEDCLTKEELKKIIKISDAKTGLIIRALYYTAARISELCGMRHKDCIIDKKGVSIQIIGKGRKLRTVFLPWKIYGEIHVIFQGKVYLFETGRGKALDRSNAWRQVAKAGKDAGIKRLHPHTLRHTWATMNLEKLGLHKVSRYLGHADISTTSKFYLHTEATVEEILRQGRLW
jgi:integrase/recombinase XerD